MKEENEKKVINQIDVKKLCNDLELEVVNKDKIINWVPIKRPAINRVGLELLGHFYNKDLNMNIIGWGTTESKFMNSIPEEKLKKNLAKVFSYNPPLVICSLGVNERNKNIILTEASKCGVPVVFTNTQLSFVITTLGTYVAEKFSPEQFVHGSFVVINGVGVLIIGDSGIGKSEAVLELIQKGHVFVSDDSVIIKRIGNDFFGIAPEITKNILEARGLGLIDIRAMYGNRVIKHKARISLVVELKQSEQGDSLHFDRLGNEKHYFSILGGKICKTIIPVRLGRNIASLIEVATNLFHSKQIGVDALKTIQERIDRRK